MVLKSGVTALAAIAARSLRGPRTCHVLCFEAKTTPGAPWLAMSRGYCDPGRFPNTPALSCPLLAYGSTGHANAPMRNASVNSGISTVAYGSLQARRAVSSHAVSPALVSPPWNPPFRGAPFQAEIHQGGKPIPPTLTLRRR